MIRNLFFLIFIGSLSNTYLLAMNGEKLTDKSPKNFTDKLDDIYSGWIKINNNEEESPPNDLQGNLTFSSVELKNISALAYAIKHGFPKIIKRLAPSESCQEMLRKARSNFIKKYGTKYALEEAIVHNNLNFVKATMSQAEAMDVNFRAQIFGIAVLNRRIKTASYICHATPRLFSIETISIINEHLSKAIADKSMIPLKILFTYNFKIPSLHKNDLLDHCLEESKRYNFTKAIFFLIKIEQIMKKDEPSIIKTL